MKQRRRKNQLQTELFCDQRSTSSPIPLHLAADRETDLKRLLAELLLTEALDNAGVPRGGECDE
jgi:hypothetical protein